MSEQGPHVRRAADLSRFRRLRILALGEPVERGDRRPRCSSRMTSGEQCNLQAGHRPPCE